MTQILFTLPDHLDKAICEAQEALTLVDETLIQPKVKAEFKLTAAQRAEINALLKAKKSQAADALLQSYQDAWKLALDQQAAAKLGASLNRQGKLETGGRLLAGPRRKPSKSALVIQVLERYLADFVAEQKAAQKAAQKVEQEITTTPTPTARKVFVFGTPAIKAAPSKRSAR